MYNRRELVTALLSHGFDPQDFDTLATFDQGPLFCFAIEGTRALECWKYLQVLSKQTGYWPVILGDATEIQRHREWFALVKYRPADIIQRATQIDAKTWIDHEKQLNTEFEDRLDYQKEQQEEIDEWLSWSDDTPLEKPNTKVYGYQDVVANKPLPVVYIGLAPTTNSLEVFAFFNFGGWNACPKPHEHIALLNYWNKTYRLELVTLGFDLIELRVGNPPTDKYAGLQLAQEQHLYCHEVESITALAGSLTNGTVWFFWWD